jgi:hypothetical protein
MGVVPRASAVLRPVGAEAPRTLQSLNGVHEACGLQPVQSPVKGYPVMTPQPGSDLLVGKRPPLLQEI